MPGVGTPLDARAAASCWIKRSVLRTRSVPSSISCSSLAPSFMVAIGNHLLAEIYGASASLDRLAHCGLFVVSLSPGPPQTSSFAHSSSFEHSKSKQPWPETRKRVRERAFSPPRTASTRGRRTRGDRSRHPSDLRMHVQQMLLVLVYVLSPRPARSPKSYPPVFKICIPASHAVIIYL